MFTCTISEDIKLKPLYFDDVKELFELTISNKEYLSKWLPWVQHNQTVANSRSFVEFTLSKYAKNDGIHVGVWYKNQLAGVVGHHKIDQLTIVPCVTPTAFAISAVVD